MRKIPLLHARIGRKYKIVEINSGAGLQNRLVSMGIYPGREVIKVSHFVLRGPVTIKIGKTVVALGYGMASKIIVAETE